LLESILPLFEPAEAPPLIVNDDIDLCLAYPGLGLHVGQDDLPVTEARARLGPDRILGLSTHSIEQAQGAINQAALLNYFAVGPVFATPTKPDYQAVGLELVRAVTDLRPPLPFFCIGGIKRDNLETVIQAGAQRVVIVSDILQTPDPAAAIQTCRRLLTKTGNLG
jgi:thiamine-phosphate pyrophosphorylase